MKKMTKINQEEYEILKKLDDKWKWIARDERHNSVCAHSLKPIKEEYGWTNIISEYNFLDARYFRFIQWEDDEPQNIAELIKEYEFGKILLAMAEEETVLEFECESKETEVLSQEWIERKYFNVDNLLDEYENDGDKSPDHTPQIKVIALQDLQNLIVPKQEEIEVKIQKLIETYKQEEGAHSNPENGWISGFVEDLKNLVEEE